MRSVVASFLLSSLLVFAAVPAAFAQQCPATVPVQGAAPPPPLPVFPADNWWNLDISQAPVDAASASFISFINNGGTRHLHPDFGGEESPGSVAVYGFPYAIVDGNQTKQAVTFEVWDESDGVDMNTGNGIPFYPIPAQAISQSHWIEGGLPGNVDDRNNNDRHLLIIDCTHNFLYELYNVFYDSAQSKWFAYSGAFFDMSANNRRTEGWTSGDASGMALFPGLVRYDEAANAAVTDIGHAFRVTVRSVNGYVYPASHVAGTTSGALPLGARLRLKALVNGLDPALRTSDPTSQKIFRAMQKYGLIVADNGSDMYISGTFDVRWNNDLLNPAFSTLTASDFEVIQLGWNPPPPTQAALSAVSASPNPVTGGNSSTGTVTLTASAPTGGALVTLGSASPSFSVPANVTVLQGATTATFAINTTPVTSTDMGTLSASYASVTKTTTVTVNPSLTLSINDVSIAEGNSGTKTMTLTVSLSAASATAVSYDISTDTGLGNATAGSDYVAKSLVGETITAGLTSKTFTVTINGDTTVEPDEAFNVNLSNASGAIIADSQSIATITNDDATLPSLSIGDASITEGNSGTQLMTFTATLSQASASTVSFAVGTGNGSATAGSDYVTLPLTDESIPAGQTSKTFTVTINGDTTVEANEVFNVDGYTPVNATFADSHALGTIVSDELPTLSIADVSITEGNSGTQLMTFTATLSQSVTAAVSFGVATANGSATAGSDYVALPLTSKTIPAGQTSKTFTVSIYGDAAVEANEVFNVNGYTPVNATFARGHALGTIVSDELPTLSIADASLSEGNSGTKAITFTVTLSQAVTAAVSFGVATANGSATAGSDYVALPLTSQTIPAGQTSKKFTVTINGDTAVEANEVFNVNGFSPVNATFARSHALGTIVSDDLPTLSIADVSITEGNSGTQLMTFTATLSQVLPATVSFSVATTDRSATAGSDYVALPLTSESIPAGQTSKTFTVTINGDTAVESNEVLYVDGSSPVNATFSRSRALGTILSEELPTLSIADAWLHELQSGTHVMTFTATLSQAVTESVSFGVATADGSATAGSDYVAKSLVGLVIPNGGTSKTFSVIVNGDTIPEVDEVFYVNLTGVVGATVANPPATGTIRNDDFPALSINDVTIVEGNSGTKTMTFTVTESPVAPFAVTYNINTAGNGSAAPTSDYVAKNLVGESIPAGQGSQTFSVTINGDTTVELDETFLVNVHEPSGATLTDSQAIGTITNDD